MEARLTEAPSPATEPRGRAAVLAKLREFMKDIRVALLTTTDGQGMLHSRPMATPAHEFDGELWFLTSRNAPIVDHIGRRPNVLVTYLDSTEDRCVTLNGWARVRRDPRRARLLWQPAWETWFPQGPTDPDLAVIEVSVVSADVWD